jgi:hypothetical protein
MPIDYRIDSQRRLAEVEVRGRLRAQDLRDFEERVRGDPAYFSGIDELIDLRGADLSGLDTAPIRSLAAFFRDGRGQREVKVAIVACRDADYGLSRMYQALRGEERGPLEIFRSIEEARAWLGLDAEEPT